jgi:hypothetical protein
MNKQKSEHHSKNDHSKKSTHPAAKPGSQQMGAKPARQDSHQSTEWKGKSQRTGEKSNTMGVNDGE